MKKGERERREVPLQEQKAEGLEKGTRLKSEIEALAKALCLPSTGKETVSDEVPSAQQPAAS